MAIRKAKRDALRRDRLDKLLVKSISYQALLSVASYIVDCESNEYDSYVSFCEENELEPNRIHGKMQKTHVYALALIGLGLEFPED